MLARFLFLGRNFLAIVVESFQFHFFFWQTSRVSRRQEWRGSGCTCCGWFRRIHIPVLRSKGCWGPESRYGSVCCRSFWHLSKMRFSLAFNFYFNIAFVIRALPTQVCIRMCGARELELEQEQKQVGNLSVVCFVPGVHRLYIHVTLESIFPAYFCMSSFFIWLSLKLCVLKTVDISMGEALSTVWVSGGF